MPVTLEKILNAYGCPREEQQIDLVKLAAYRGFFGDKFKGKGISEITDDEASELLRASFADSVDEGITKWCELTDKHILRKNFKKDAQECEGPFTNLERWVAQPGKPKDNKGGSWPWVTKGTIPLHVATRMGPAQADIIKDLITAQADIQAKTSHGTPVEYLQKYTLPSDREAFTGIMAVAASQSRAAFFAGHHPRTGSKSSMALAASRSSIFTPDAWNTLLSFGTGNTNSEEGQNIGSFRI